MDANIYLVVTFGTKYFFVQFFTFSLLSQKGTRQSIVDIVIILLVLVEVFGKILSFTIGTGSTSRPWRWRLLKLHVLFEDTDQAFFATNNKSPSTETSSFPAPSFRFITSLCDFLLHKIYTKPSLSICKYLLFQASTEHAPDHLYSVL